MSSGKNGTQQLHAQKVTLQFSAPKRGKINRTLQKDESLGVVSASKQGRER